MCKKTITLFVLVICFCLPRAFSQNIMITYAGTGDAGYSGDGGPANAAELQMPSGVCRDAAGNIYICDENNNVVRKINATTHIITTIAGTGAGSYSGDGGPAVNATLFAPFRCAIDHAGNLYISDKNNSRIRKITAGTGIISTIVGLGVSGYSGDGGLAIHAAIGLPAEMAIDSIGNIYFADADNDIVRKIDAATGIISRVAGSNPGVPGYTGDGGPATAASLYDPMGLSLDKQGNLYISDMMNNVVRKVDKTTNIITTVVGNGIEGYTGDGGQAIDAELEGPAGLYFDDSDNLYIADISCEIRKVNAVTHIITTVAGTAGTGYDGDGGLATSEELNVPCSICTDLQGHLIIADQGNNRIRMAEPKPDAVAQLQQANVGFSLYPNPAGNTLSVKTTGNNVVAIYDVAGRMVLSQAVIAPKTSIDITMLPAGTYQATMGSSVQKFVKE